MYLKNINFTIAIIALLCLVLTGTGVTKENESGVSTPVIVNAAVDHSEITIGEKVRFSITVERDEDVSVSFPEIGEALADFTVKSRGIDEPESLNNGMTLQREWYVLETFSIGSYVIPPLKIQYDTPDGKSEEMETNEVFIVVKSVMAAGETVEDIREIRGPVNVSVNYTRLYLIIAAVFGALAIAAGIVYFFKKRKGVEKVIAPPPPLPAHVIAYRALQKLVKMDLVIKGKVPEYYSLLSDIMRRYLENRFKLMAPERTTEEFLSEMSKADIMVSDHKLLIKKFLEHCDLVKFAKYGPDEEEIKGVYDAAKKLVDETLQLAVFENEKINA